MTRDPRQNRSAWLAATALGTLLLAAPAGGEPLVNLQGGPVVLYANDFETDGAIAPEWSYGWVSSTPASGCMYCGRFLGEMARRDSTTLTTPEAPPGRAVLLRFDLLILRSWDGDAQHNPSFGPDRFGVSVAAGVNPAPDPTGQSLCLQLQTGVAPTPAPTPATCSSYATWTFANYRPGCHLSAPTQGYPAAGSAPQQGAVAVDTLGYGMPCGDSVYPMVFVVVPGRGMNPILPYSMYIEFSGSTTRGVEDEAWGVDNVVITTL